MPSARLIFGSLDAEVAMPVFASEGYLYAASFSSGVIAAVIVYGFRMVALNSAERLLASAEGMDSIL
jgi:predicted permease